LQDSAGSALAPHPQHPVPPPINEDGSTSQNAPGSEVACDVCGSNMRCFLNVSCICAMSHHLQESARKNTQKKSKSSSSRHIICEHNRRRSICKECNGGSVCSHGKQRIWCGDCGGKARCDHGKQRSKCLECGGVTEEKGYVRIASSGIGAPIVTFRNKLERNCLCFAVLLCLLFIYYSSCSSVLCHICAVWSCC